jgi:hypothetical protein
VAASNAESCGSGSAAAVHSRTSASYAAVSFGLLFHCDQRSAGSMGFIETADVGKIYAAIGGGLGLRRGQAAGVFARRALCRAAGSPKPTRMSAALDNCEYFGRNTAARSGYRRRGAGECLREARAESGGLFAAACATARRDAAARHERSRLPCAFRWTDLPFVNAFPLLSLPSVHRRYHVCVAGSQRRHAVAARCSRRSVRSFPSIAASMICVSLTESYREKSSGTGSNTCRCRSCPMYACRRESRCLPACD